MRLFFEVYGLALRHPNRYSNFLGHTVHDWLDEPMAAVDDISATLAIATVTGLLLDLLTTNDRARIDNAMERFLILLRSHADRRTRHLPPQGKHWGPCLVSTPGPEARGQGDSHQAW